MKDREFLMRLVLYVEICTLSMIGLWCMNLKPLDMPMAVLLVSLVEFFAVFLIKLPKKDIM